MRIQRYADTKEGGIEWCDQLPIHWKKGKIRWLCNRYSGGTPDKENHGYWENGSIPWLNSGAVNDRLIKEPSALITERALEESSAKWIPKGSLLIALAGQGKTKGMVAQLGIRATCNQSMAAIVPTGKGTSRYLFWWLDANYQNIRNMAGGDLRDGLNLQLLGDITFPIPPKEEQHSISNFLDRETAKIDALIAEKERLIELLQEKRQAVVSHAVTKGLNPDVPMKDSGVEWLGEVPEHWAIGPVKRFLSSMNYKRVPLSSEERSTRQGNYPYYGASGIIDSVDDFLFNESLVLVSEDGANLLMRSTPIAFEAHGEYWVNNHAHILRPNDGLTLFWSERIECVEIAPFITGSAQPKLTAEALLNLTISCPLEIEEKRAIEEVIKSVRLKLDPLIKTAESAVKLLRERRSALISAAVTGQIDVRGLAPQEEAA